MTLSLLTKSMVLHFKQITNGLNKQIAARGEVKGKSELERIVSEYQQRFGISLENLAHFATVREIVLARNSVFHGDGSPSKDYMEKTNARFLDEVGQINLTSELLNTSIAELKEFLLALSVALKDAYRAAKAAAEERSTREIGLLHVKIAKGRPPANTAGVQAERIPGRPLSLKLALPALAMSFFKKDAKRMKIFERRWCAGTTSTRQWPSISNTIGLSSRLTRLHANILKDTGRHEDRPPTWVPLVFHCTTEDHIEGIFNDGTLTSEKGVVASPSFRSANLTE